MDESSWWFERYMSRRRAARRTEDEDLEREWKRRDEEHQSLLGHISELVVKNARLVEENSRLKHRLDTESRSVSKMSMEPIQEANRTEKEYGSTAETEQKDLSTATVPYEEYHYMTEKYNDLRSRYHETKTVCKSYKAKIDSVMEKNEKMKDSVKAWAEYVDKRVKGTPTLETGTHTPRLLPRSIKNATTPLPPTPTSIRPSAMKFPQPIVGAEKSSPPTSPSDLGREQSGLPADGHLLDQPLNSSLDFRLPTATHPAPSTDPGERSPNHGTAQSGKIAVPALPRDLEPVETTELPHGGRPQEETAQNTTYVTTDKLPSSQTTRDDEAQDMPPPSAVPDDDDDVPQFVSERSLKRKRDQPTRTEIYRDHGVSSGSPANPYRIKEEQFSSPPPPEVASNLLTRKETLDLDDIGSKVIATPKHQRAQNFQLSRRRDGVPTNVVASLHQERSRSEPIKEERLGSSGSLMATKVTNGRGKELNEAQDRENRGHTGPPPPLERGIGALQSVDPNIQRLSEHVEEKTSSKRQSGDEHRHREQFQFMAESGETPPPENDSENARSAKLTPSAARARFNKRLQASKPSSLTKRVSPPSPRKHHTDKQKAVQNLRPGINNVSTSDVTPSRPSSRVGAVAGAHQPSASRPTSRAGRPSDMRPPPRLSVNQKDNTLLRSKPLNELRVSDFKPNPMFNHGYSYAFSETVRNRDARACLPGCTKPDCCGSAFRALAVTAPPLSSSQEEELLEDFLGDIYDPDCISKMRDDEKAELVLQARTRHMAAKHGKHKQAYERRTTPPGFWRADFPTTQEEREDRERANQIERTMVQERWGEAMRKGGRWMFRDE
ncbi:hypothetical protein GQ43DRAFT_15439 [Delitschia confertaspora ATCC 74209]|uniref:DNA endonuclease activator Ctp1 C-terminal domain-containing protein n=1 Tax=Delitschia confertaspora ATCC 74209 TaxID=1513339 RepID=A0A9P4JZJ9_9PLEO|nr:hypothetical protein GQ43DRAFT_15439 [Delitschia confertaspora ATCC 74209]